jgi:hypothetical protein|tara:strand:- start:449 stop:1675 length:1227 start_codon:yes stop_codon:yes gene_type:complete
MIPRIEENDNWNSLLLSELINDRYALEQQEDGVYLHWCEINCDIDSHAVMNGNILSFIPDHVINDVREGKAKIVFSTWQESTNPIDTYPIEHCIDFDIVLEQFCDDACISCNDVIWISGDLKVQERQRSTRITAHGFTCYGHDILRHIESDISRDMWKLKPITERVFEKDFMCLQRFMKPGRIYLSLLLYRANLIHTQYVSIADRINGWGFLEKARAFYIATKDNHQHMSTREVDDDYFIDMWHDLADLGLHVPMIVDVHDHDKNWCAGADTTLSSLDFYNKSFASIITETDMQSNGLFISEATFRSFIYQHPCVWAGQSGIVQQLKDWGFKTWDWLASEEYDECVYMIDRLDMCRDSLLEMISVPRSEHILKRIHEQNIYNWDHLKHKFVEDQRDRFAALLNKIVDK